MYTVYKKIKEVREKFNFSQEYMANELGISQPAYSKLEDGTTNINIERLINISHILGVDPLEFLESEKTINQYENDYAYGFVENLYQDNKEIYEKLIATLEEEIRLLKKENDRLSNLLNP